MGWPVEIRITAKVSYRIVWVDRFADSRVAECCPHSHTITLKKGMSRKATEESLIHEILHALEFTHSLQIPHAAIHQLEGPIRRMLKLNGWMK